MLRRNLPSAKGNKGVSRRQFGQSLSVLLLSKSDNRLSRACTVGISTTDEKCGSLAGIRCTHLTQAQILGFTGASAVIECGHAIMWFRSVLGVTKILHHAIIKRGSAKPFSLNLWQYVQMLYSAQVDSQTGCCYTSPACARV